MSNDPGDGRRERHKQQRRLAIVRATRELLREDARQGLTKEAIAERADVSPAPGYNLVGTRAQLFSALAQDFMEEVARRVADRPPADALKRARRVVELTCDVILDDPLVYAALVRGWDESGLMLRQEPTALLSALSDAQAEGALVPEVDVRHLASSVATSCLGAVHQWASGLIDARKFRMRALFSLDLAIAAAASPARQKELGRALHRRRNASRER